MAALQRKGSRKQKRLRRSVVRSERSNESHGSMRDNRHPRESNESNRGRPSRMRSTPHTAEDNRHTTTRGIGAGSMLHSTRRCMHAARRADFDPLTAHVRHVPAGWESACTPPDMPSFAEQAPSHSLQNSYDRGTGKGATLRRRRNHGNRRRTAPAYAQHVHRKRHYTVIGMMMWMESSGPTGLRTAGYCGDCVSSAICGVEMAAIASDRNLTFSAICPPSPWIVASI